MALRADVSDFLFENSHRSFPFKFYGQEQVELSFSSVLDLKIFSRSGVVGNVRLIGASRWSGVGTPPVLPVALTGMLLSGKVQLFFEIPSVGSNIYTSISVNINETEWPHMTSNAVSDTIGTRYVVVSGILDNSILDDFTVNGYTEFSNVFVENSLVCEAYKKSIDQLRIIHSNGDVELVTGNIVFVNGVNSSVSLSGATTRINARLGEGNGKQKYEGEDVNEKCKDAVITVNGIYPSEKGVFYIKGGNGISVVDVPAENKIVVSIQKGSNLIVCEDAP